MVEFTSAASSLSTRRSVPAIAVPRPAAATAAVSAARHGRLPGKQTAGTGTARPAGSSALERSHAAFDVPSPSGASISGQSLLYEALPADLLWPVRPPSPTVAPVLNIGVNRLALFRAVDAELDAVLEASKERKPERPQRDGTRKERRRPAVGARQRTEEELVDEHCATAAAFHYQQQLRLDVSHPAQPAAAKDTSLRVADSVHSLTTAASSAHRYRLYTDSLIDVGLHHEAELRRQWIAMETQARSINRSAERAARRDMRDTVREIVNAAKAGKCNDVRDKLKEATQHVDEANEARNSRAAIYTDDKLYLPMSRSTQRETAVKAAMAGEKSSIGHLNARQPLFDPVPQTNEFEHSTQQHVAFHSFRDDDRAGQREQTEIALPAVVEQMRRQMEAVEQEREERKREDDKLKRLHRAEKREQKRRARLLQLQLAAEQQQTRLGTPAQPPAPPPTAETHYGSRAVRRPHSSAAVGRSGSAATNRRSSAIRAPLWTQGQGDVMLAEVSQFTLLRSKEDERRKEEERRLIADDEKRTREQWLADERREEREREEKEQADRERRLREQEEDEREDRERRLRFFPSPPRPARDRAETDGAMLRSAVADSSHGNDDSEAIDHFSHSSPLPAARSPERSLAALSASDGSQRRRSSIAVGARRISLTAGGGLPGIAHRRQSSLLPPSSPSLSSTRTSTNRSYRSSLSSTAAFPLSQVRSRWQNAAGKTGPEHLARRFSLVAANDTTQQQQHTSSQPHPSQQQQQQQHHHPAMAAMLPAPIDPDSSLVATNYSHDPLHSSYLQQQREQRRSATAQVYDTVKRWLEEKEEEKNAASSEGSDAQRSSGTGSLSFDPQLVTPFSSILSHQPYSPRSQQRHHSMRQQLPLSVSNPAVFAWMRRHAIVPRRTIDPSEEVKVRPANRQSHTPPHARPRMTC